MTTTTTDTAEPILLRARVLGPVRLELHDTTLRLGGPTQRAILGMLLLDAGQVVSRSRLVDGVWGPDPPATADATIQSHVSRVRRALRDRRVDDVLVTRSPGYVIDPARVDLDLRAFEQAVQRARDLVADDDPAGAEQVLDRALATWTGDPVADLHDFPFAMAATARLGETRLSAVEAHNDCLLALGQVSVAVPRLRELVDQHPLRERFRQQMMLALYHAGRHTEALDELRAFRQLLDDELGLEPGPALDDLQQRILAHEVPPPSHAHEPGAGRRTGDHPDPGVDAGPRHEPAGAGPAGGDRDGGPASPARVLPGADLDEFIGRRTELHAVESRLADGVRLVTITGTGGAGKSRLALEVARRWEGQKGRAPTIVGLDSLTDPELIITRIARAFELQGRPSAAAIGDLLAGRTTLLVLDNMEHLLAGVAGLGDLLRHAPGLAILATSQVPLRISGEHEVAVPPLPLPVGHDAADLRHNDAVRLFVSRARARVAAFDDEDDTVHDVAAVVRLLDGMPLAIELAAARVKVLAPGSMLAPVRQGLDVLADPGRPGTDRQRTLVATIAWSVGLLPAVLRHVLVTLSVLVGRFDLDDAAAITAGDSDMAVVDALGQLADHSLVQRIDVNGRVRFGLLRTIRLFAQQELARDPGLAEEVRRRRDRHFVREAASRAARMVDEVGAASTSWVREHVDDLRAVLDDAWERGDDALCRELAASLAMFWGFVQSPQGRRWMERGLRSAPAADAEQRARLHTGLARMCMFGGPLDVAEQHARDALACVQQGAQPHNAVFAHNVLGQVAAHDGRGADADGHALAAMAIAEGPDGSDMLAIIARNYRADMLLTFQRWDEASAISLEVLDLLAADGRHPTTEHEVFALSNLAVAQIQADEVQDAARVLGALADATDRVRTPVGQAMVLLGHAALAARTDLSTEHGRRLADAAVSLLERHGAGLGVPEQRLLDDTAQRLSAHQAAPPTRRRQSPGRARPPPDSDLDDSIGAVRDALGTEAG